MMPRDGGEDDIIVGDGETPRRGRAVPPAELRVIDIKLTNGSVVGSLDLRTLTGRAQFDLEDALSSPTPATALLKWLEKHAGLAAADVPAVREELADMPVREIIDLMIAISEAVGKAMQLPNGSPRASRRR